MQNSRTFNEEIKYGKIGENFFETTVIKIFSSMPYYYNVSEIPIFQLIDIDYIVSKKPLNLKKQEEQFKIVNELKKHHIDNIKKCDFYKNLCLELTTHDKPGAFGISRADFWCYISMEKSQNFNNKLTPYCFWLINTYKMRRYFGENSSKNEKKSGIRLYYWKSKEREWDSHCLNILVNENILIEKGIVKKYEINGTL